MFPGRAVSCSFHVTAELSLQFPVVVQSRDPADAVMKAHIYSVQFCLLGVCRWSPGANILVFTEHVLSGGMGRTPLPAFPGFYVTSFLGLEPSSSDLQQTMSLLSILLYISLLLELCKVIYLRIPGLRR